VHLSFRFGYHGDSRGTDVNVFITVIGSNGDSGERNLEGPGNNFEQKQTDTFGFDCVDWIIRHDNSEVGPGWFLNKVTIESGKGDKQISRNRAYKDDSTYAPLIKILL